LLSKRAIYAAYVAQEFLRISYELD